MKRFKVLVLLPMVAAVLFLMAPTCAREQATASWVGIDQARQQQGAPPLKWDQRIAQYTNVRAYHIATTGDFTHSGFLAAANQFALQQPTWEICEILVWTSDPKPVDLGLQAWRTSAEHWACVMNPRHTNAAISAFIGEDGKTYQVMWAAGEP